MRNYDEKLDINGLEDIAPYALEHLVPAIQLSVDSCIESYYVDEQFNDMWTFGTQLWKNTWNRFKFLTEEFDNCPFEICGKGNEYKIKIGAYILRHHRIDNETKLPSGAKAAKASAGHQMSLFGENRKAPVKKENIILAIDADVQNGLKEVFLGELKQKNPERKQYIWGKKVPVYLTDGFEASSPESILISNMPGFEQFPPEEEVAEVSMKLDKTKNDKRQHAPEEQVAEVPTELDDTKHDKKVEGDSEK